MSMTVNIWLSKICVVCSFGLLVACDDGGECIAESSCREVRIVDPPSNSCVNLDDATPMGVADPAAAKCVLESLRDGELGPYLIDRSPDGFGFCGFRRRVSVLDDDRNVIVVEGEYVDLGGENVVRKGKLKSAAKFQECLDAGPNGYAACLIAPIEYVTEEADCECEAYCDDVFYNDPDI